MFVAIVKNARMSYEMYGITEVKETPLRLLLLHKDMAVTINQSVARKHSDDIGVKFE